jgi:hypothetical protein
MNVISEGSTIGIRAQAAGWIGQVSDAQGRCTRIAHDVMEMHLNPTVQRYIVSEHFHNRVCNPCTVNHRFPLFLSNWPY